MWCCIIDASIMVALHRTIRTILTIAVCTVHVWSGCVWCVWYVTFRCKLNYGAQVFMGEKFAHFYGFCFCVRAHAAIVCTTDFLDNGTEFSVRLIVQIWQKTKKYMGKCHRCGVPFDANKWHFGPVYFEHANI